MADIGHGGEVDNHLLFHAIFTTLVHPSENVHLALQETVDNNESTSIDNSSLVDGSEQLFQGYSSALLHFASTCCVLFILVGVPGNLITIIALFRCKKVRNATAIFIINLSVSDLMFCCFNLPLAASTFWQRSWPHGHFLCELFPLTRYGLVAVSLFSVLSITINRYVMIGHPRLYPKLYRKQNLGLMIGCTWVFGFGALIPTWFGIWGRFGLDVHIGSCSILPDVYGHSPKESLFIIAFVIPCLAIVVCYARIFYIVRKTAMKSRINTITTTSQCMRFWRTTKPEEKKLQGSKMKYSTPQDSVLGSTITSTQMENGHSKSSSDVIVHLSPNHLRLPLPSSSSGVDTEYDENGSCSSLSATPSSLCSSLVVDPVPSKRDVQREKVSARQQVASIFKRSSPHRQTVMISSGLATPGKMTTKDKKLLKMILVIFSSFLICYLPITVSKTFKGAMDIHELNIAGYILIYLTTCINPIIYVVMSSEYRQAYKNLLMCRTYSQQQYHHSGSGLEGER